MDKRINITGTEGLEWPYRVDYDKVNHINVDIAVIGGSFAGCGAALAAAKKGLKIALIDKAPIRRAGNGGAGIDHWNGVFDNPKSPFTPEEVMDLQGGGKGVMHKDYIAVKGSWDALLEMEKLGLPVRDELDEFLGTPTRDEDLKIMKAYDYRNLVAVKLRGGHFIKDVLYNAVSEDENISLFNRVMVTSLFTENGLQNTPVAGCGGFSLETGEFFVFHAKTVIIASGYTSGCWIMSTELTGNSYRWDPNDTGEGMAMAWTHGAEIYNMHVNGTTKGQTPFAWPRFGVGNATSTWYPCSMVDNDNKDIPWVDTKGKPIETVAKRNVPDDDDDLFYGGAGLGWLRHNPGLVKDLDKRLEGGDLKAPLWADLPSLPDEERRSIWGLMIGNEGKTRYTLYDYFTRWGFNPEKDMLMAPLMDPQHYNKNMGPWFAGVTGEVKPWRTEYRMQGEIASDWDMMTTVPGLFVAGAAGGLEGCSFSITTGMYAGSRAADYCAHNELKEIDEAEFEREHDRVYAPVRRADDPEAYVSWKELWAGSCRVMQQACAEYYTVPILECGLYWMQSIKDYEMQLTYARNPHELARVLECESRITVSEIFMSACREKLILDQEHQLPKGTHYFIKLDGDKVVPLTREPKYWLKGDNAPTYLENYEKHTHGKDGE